MVLGGWNLMNGVRLQIREEAGWAVGVDDLSRRTVGGLTPFTVNLPGMPWAYVHADKCRIIPLLRFISDCRSMTLKQVSLTSWLTVQDFQRVGDTDFTALWGIGGFVDYRFGNWQFDLRGGYSPALRELHSQQGAWSVLGVLGWGSAL